MKKRIGFYGGSFNPIHNGHLNIANKALSQFNLDEIWFVVTGVSPHKITGFNVNRFARFDMTRLALNDYPGLIAKDFELFDTEKSFSANTLSNLHKLYPEAEFFFIMGEDSIESFRSWYNPHVISELSTILVAPRIDDSSCNLSDCLIRLENTLTPIRNNFHGDFYAIESKNIPVSSSAIRDSISNKEYSLAKEYLPKVVYDYILEHQIYKTVQTYDYASIREGIKSTLKPERYHHSLRVADTACALANIYHFPHSTAYIAGLLHDCGKYMSDQQSLDFCNENKIEITKTEHIAPYLLHGKIGAFLAGTQYGINDPDITHAISVHTTGCPNMSLLDKIIYVSDYIEPERDKSMELNTIRAMAYRDLDTAIILIIKETIDFLEKTKKPIDKTTTDTLEFYERRKGLYGNIKDS